MDVKLDAVSPIAFELVREGHPVRLQFKRSDKREYREKIVARDCFLVFRGQTKIGMVPTKLNEDHADAFKTRNWRIKVVDAIRKVVSITDETFEQTSN